MKYEKEKVWRIEGDFMESCNCAVSCPCALNSTGNNTMPATEGHCDLILAFHIEKGHFENVDLSDLAFAIISYSAGPLMSVPNWSMGYYIDDRATDEQFEVMTKLLKGEAGGLPKVLYAYHASITAFRRAKVSLIRLERGMKLTVDDICEANVMAIKGLYDDEVVKVTNIHPLAGDVVQAYNGITTYNDGGFHFNNTGRTAFYSRFIWQDNYNACLKAGN